MKNKKPSGFTLAEVLITLAIIGVIAAISVPSLIQKTNQAELITAWKKNYATLSQALSQLDFDSGNVMSYTKSHGSLKPALQNYLKGIKDSNNAGLYTAADIRGIYTDLSGANLNGTASLMDDGQIILNSGAIIYIENSPSTKTNLMIWVDVNGEKKPNIIGKDLFGSELIDGNLIPMGVSTGSSINCDCTSTACSKTMGTYSTASNIAGAGCSAEYLYKSK